jgi:hypothetical protein
MQDTKNISDIVRAIISEIGMIVRIMARIGESILRSRRPKRFGAQRIGDAKDSSDNS